MKHKLKNAPPDTKRHVNYGRCLYAAFLAVTVLCGYTQPVFAATIWTKANEIMKDVYNQIILISTIAAVVTASVALLMMNFSKSGKTVDESRAWLKRIVITWAILNGLTVLSLMLSFAVAPAVSKVTANYLVSQQVQQMQEEEKNNEGKVSTEYVAPKQDVQSISVEVTPEMYLLDGVSVLVLITASVLVSGIVILKRNPKDILSEMS